MHNFVYTTTMVYGTIGDACICMHVQGVKPTDADWVTFINYLEENASRIRVGLTYAGNVKPSALQRQSLSEMWERIGDVVPCVVMTDDLIVRGIIAAINSFLRKPLRAMAPKEFESACDYLMIKRGDRAPIRALIETHVKKEV